jgi:hypothetical protein
MAGKSALLPVKNSSRANVMRRTHAGRSHHFRRSHMRFPTQATNAQVVRGGSFGLELSGLLFVIELNSPIGFSLKV